MAVYVTVDAVKRYLGIPTGDVADDALLLDLCDAAEEMVDMFTGRTFRPVTETRTFDYSRVTADGILPLDADLARIDEVINGDGVDVTGYVVGLPDTHRPPWRWLRLTGDSPYVWTYVDRTEDAIAVTGVWGYAETVPMDVIVSATRLAAWLYRQRDTLGDSDRIVRTPEGALVMPGAMPVDVQAVLTRYRLVTV